MTKIIENYEYVCPKCGSQEFYGERPEVDCGEAWQTLVCESCGARWREVYTFAFAEIDEEE